MTKVVLTPAPDASVASYRTCLKVASVDVVPCVAWDLCGSELIVVSAIA